MPSSSTLAGSAPSRLATLIVLLATSLLTTNVGIHSADAAETPGPGLDDATLYGAVQAEQRADILADTAGLLSSYTIDAVVSADDPSRIDGQLALRYVNDTGRERSELYLRLYANDPIYAPDGTDLGEITAAGRAIPAELSVDDTVVRLTPPEPLANGASLDLAIPFTTTVPETGQGYGMFGVADVTGTLSLAHWYPILAGYGPDGVWNLDPPSVIGDPIFSNTALYDVAITAADGLRVVTTGQETAAEPAGDGQTRRDFVTGPVRDFMMVIDDDFAVAEQEIDGTLVRSWFNRGDDAAGERVLRYGVQALELFNGLIGLYPYEEMDLVQVPIGGGAAGVEFPQLMVIASSLYDRPDQPGIPGFLENVVAHEVVHQWWYALVGNDQYRDAFIDEGLTNYLSTAIYFEHFYTPEIGQGQVDLYLLVPYLDVLSNRGDEVVHQPTDDFSPSDYGVIIYGKAALGFGAFHEVLGDDVFFAALQDYYLTLRFEVATPADLLAAFERASGEDLGELWRLWFEAAEGKGSFAEDLADTIPALAA